MDCKKISAFLEIRGKVYKLYLFYSSLDICLSNFLRLGRTLRSCGLNFDARVACDIINKETGVVYNILHELYIYLHCTNQAERLASIQKWESLCPHANSVYQQQLRRLVPRQIDKTLKEVAGQYKTKQEQNEKQAEYRELLLTYQREERKQAKRKQMLERSRQLRLAQAEVMARIQANVIEVPKKWLTSAKQVAPKPEKLRMSTEGMQALKDLEEFDLRMKARSHSEEKSQVPDSATYLIDRVTHVPEADNRPVDFVAESLKPEESEAYVRRIKERVRTEQLALQERQRRQRRVIIASLEEQRAQEV
ncbi:sperm flagellar protein 2, partial [Clonorchis sinensis]